MIKEPKLNCTYPGHENSPIEGVCVNNNCQELRPFCLFCIKNFHNQHLDDLKEFNELTQLRQQALNFIVQLKSTIDDLELFAKILKEFIMMTKNFKSDSQTIVDINNETQRILKVQSYNTTLSEELLQLVGKIQSICNKFNVLKSQEEDQIKAVQFRLLKEQQIVLDVQKPQFNFSLLNKCKYLKVSEQQNEAEGSSGFCLCEPSIPSTSITRITFKMTKGLWLYIGVCHSDINNAKYYPHLKETGHGFYLISQNGHTFSNHQKEMNMIQQSFEFRRNDSIIVEVDMGNRKITWVKKSYFFNKTFVTFLSVLVNVTQYQRRFFLYCWISGLWLWKYRYLDHECYMNSVISSQFLTFLYAHQVFILNLVLNSKQNQFFLSLKMGFSQSFIFNQFRCTICSLKITLFYLLQFSEFQFSQFLLNDQQFKVYNFFRLSNSNLKICNLNRSDQYINTFQ